MVDIEFMEKLKTFKARIVHHDQFAEHIELIETRMQMAGVIDEPQSLGILGASGYGKTSIAKTIIKKYGKYYEENSQGRQLIVPVFFLKLPATRGLVDLISGMLDELQVLYGKKDSVSALKKKLIKALKDCKTKIIFLDEIQQIGTGSGMSIVTVRNWIKNFLDDANIPVVFIGMPEGEVVLSGSELGRRVNPIVHVKPFSFPTKIDGSLVQTLKKLAVWLKEDCGISIHQADTPVLLAQRLWVAGGGLIGQMRSVIFDAAIMAHRKGAVAITLEILADAYKASPPRTSFAKKENPFLIKASELTTIAAKQTAAR